MLADAQGMYSDEYQGARFAAGDAITIAGSGDVVPAFTASVVFPADVVVTAPTALSAISKSGLHATWNPTTATVHVVVTQYPSSTLSLSINCAYAGNAGAANVAATSLSDLMVGSATTNVVIAPEAIATSAVGPYALTVIAATFAFQSGVTVQP